MAQRTQTRGSVVQTKTDRIRCKECGRWFATITGSHLHTHGLTVDEYRQEYGVDFLVPEAMRVRQSRSRRRLKGGGTYIPLDRKGILRRIKSIDASGGSLDLATVRVKRAPLLRLAVKIFGRWSTAVRSAGVDYERHMRFARWSTTRVVSRIKERRRAGESLRYRDVEREDCGLLNAARRYYSSWNDALRAAGVDPEKTSAVVHWSRKRIVAEIKALQKARKPLNTASMRTINSGLLSAARRHFGAWERALKAAGCDVSRIRKRRDWDRRSVAAEIRRLRKRGESLNVATARETHSGLVWAARHYYGTWDRALKAAGMDPKKIRLRAERRRRR